MKFILLDVRESSFLSSDNHLLFIVVAFVSLAALVGIFIYRKRKSK